MPLSIGYICHNLSSKMWCNLLLLASHWLLVDVTLCIGMIFGGNAGVLWSETHKPYVYMRSLLRRDGCSPVEATGVGGVKPAVLQRGDYSYHGLFLGWKTLALPARGGKFDFFWAYIVWYLEIMKTQSWFSHREDSGDGETMKRCQTIIPWVRSKSYVHHTLQHRPQPGLMLETVEYVWRDVWSSDLAQGCVHEHQKLKNWIPGC